MGLYSQALRHILATAALAEAADPSVPMVPGGKQPSQTLYSPAMGVSTDMP